MSNIAELRKRINDKTAVIGVIGLGYVGLPVAASFAKVGFQVVGLDIKQDRVAIINSGDNPIEGDEPGLAPLLAEVNKNGRLKATISAADLTQADVILIDVETPVGEDHIPRYEVLQAACTGLGPVLKEGALVIVESTVSPGTTDRLVRPLLEKHSGLRAGKDFYLGVCPERVMPGKLLNNLRTMSRVCGGSTPETAEAMVALYRHIVEADLDIADPVTAEMVKTTENTYRDVQIAFANEVALICEAAGADVWLVRELVNKVPSRQMHLPGPGVGGHCIPKDPWLLAYSGRDQASIRLIPQTRAVNDGMPHHMANLVVDALDEAGLSATGARIVVLGYAYLENSDDPRNSPSIKVVDLLLEFGADVQIHDPWITAYKGDLPTLVLGSDAIVVMVAHNQYLSLDLNMLKTKMRTHVIVDGRRVIGRKEATMAGFIFRGIGQGSGR